LVWALYLDFQYEVELGTESILNQFGGLDFQFKMSFDWQVYLKQFEMAD
jgi:hypothetical protein